MGCNFIETDIWFAFCFGLEVVIHMVCHRDLLLNRTHSMYSLKIGFLQNGYLKTILNHLQVQY